MLLWHCDLLGNIGAGRRGGPAVPYDRFAASRMQKVLRHHRYLLRWTIILLCHQILLILDKYASPPYLLFDSCLSYSLARLATPCGAFLSLKTDTDESGTITQHEFFEILDIVDTPFTRCVTIYCLFWMLNVVYWELDHVKHNPATLLDHFYISLQNLIASLYLALIRALIMLVLLLTVV